MSDTPMTIDLAFLAGQQRVLLADMASLRNNVTVMIAVFTAY